MLFLETYGKLLYRIRVPSFRMHASRAALSREPGEISSFPDPLHPTPVTPSKPKVRLEPVLVFCSWVSDQVWEVPLAFSGPVGTWWDMGGDCQTVGIMRRLVKAKPGLTCI